MHIALLFLVAQLAPQYLADVGLRNFVTKPDVLRFLVPSELFLAVVHKLIADRLARMVPLVWRRARVITAADSGVQHLV